MSFCSNCGTKNPDGAKFCEKCGKEFSSANGGDVNIITNEVAPPPKKRSFIKKLIFGVIGIFVILALIGSCMGEPKSKGTSGGQGAKQAEKAPEYNYTCDVEGIGKVKGVMSSDVGVAIAKIQEMPTIDAGYTNARAQGVFKVIYIVASNQQKDAVTLDANSYKLIDSAGREYTHSVEGDTQLEMSNRETLFLKKINPGITTGGYISYDVPKNADIVKLQFRGGFAGKKAEVPFKVMLEK